MYRWIERIQEYDIDVTYRKGVEVVSTDTLSRLYEKQAENDEINSRKENQKKIVEDIHEWLMHGGLGSVKYESSENHNWPKCKASIQEVIDAREVCNKNDRKQGGGSEIAETTKKLEKTAIDIMEIGEEEKFILSSTDCITRLL